MSDGNFNRQLLPKTELSSGLRAGKAQMRVKAELAFRQILNEEFHTLPDAEQQRLRDRFMQLLRE